MKPPPQASEKGLVEYRVLIGDLSTALNDSAEMNGRLAVWRIEQGRCFV